MWKAFKYNLKKELLQIKYHVFRILAVIVKYVAPIIVIFAKAMTRKESVSLVETWALPIVGFLALMYWCLIRKALFKTKNEESIVKRLDKTKARPIRELFATLIDDVIMTPFIPLILFLFARVVESFAYKSSLCFLVITICFVVGGVFQMVDILLEMKRDYEEMFENEQ